MNLTRIRTTLAPALAVVALALATTALPALGNHYILCGGDDSKCDPPLPPPPTFPSTDDSFVDAGPKAVGGTRYIATRIPPQPFFRSTTADAISPSGDIVGAVTRYQDNYVYADELDVTAFVFTADNVFTTIQTPGTASHANGINGRGDVVGVYQQDGRSHAFKFSQGMVIDLPLPGAQDSGAMAINDAGDVAGTRDARAFVLRADGRLDVLGFESYGNAINAFGEAAGFFFSSRAGGHNVYHALRYGGGATEDLGAIDIYTYAHAINASGDVVGESFGVNNTSVPFLYRDGRMQAIGNLKGTANAINAAGTVVGTVQNAGAFMYADGQVYYLADLVDGLDGGRLLEAYAINDAGQIAARACSRGPDFECYGVRLDPVPVPSVRAIEFYHPGMDHYFMTADATEIAKLDVGTIAGWMRTGEEFDVKPGPQVGTAPVCRMFSASFAPKSSHFYTPSATECAVVKRNARWQFEGIVFYVAMPDADGVCPAGKAPVYRLYNGGQSGAPNHRYTTSTAVRDRMIAQGWIPEGNGALGVAMCSTPD